MPTNPFHSNLERILSLAYFLRQNVVTEYPVFTANICLGLSRNSLQFKDLLSHNRYDQIWGSCGHKTEEGLSNIDTGCHHHSPKQMLEISLKDVFVSCFVLLSVLARAREGD